MTKNSIPKRPIGQPKPVAGSKGSKKMTRYEDGSVEPRNRTVMKRTDATLKPKKGK